MCHFPINRLLGLNQTPFIPFINLLVLNFLVLFHYPNTLVVINMLVFMIYISNKHDEYKEKGFATSHCHRSKSQEAT